MRVLLVTHEATRSGAPKVALDIARALSQDDHDVRCVSRRPGPLLEEFAAVAPTRIEPLYRIRRRLWLSSLRRIAYAIDSGVATVTVAIHRPDLVYLNSASSAVYVAAARRLRRPVVLHLHESGATATTFLSQARALNRLHEVTVVACSPSVQRDAVDTLRMREGTVQLLLSVPDGEQVQRLAAQTVGGDDGDTVYPPEAVVVGACGTVERRKGTDLWLEMVADIERRNVHGLPLQFVWIGSTREPLVDEVSMGMFPGATANPYPHLKRFDVLTVPSREDPFPLVVLEAMSLGTPVVAFAVDGIPDQIGDAGVTVPPEDVEQLATAVLALCESPQRRAQLGRRALERVEQQFSFDRFRENLREVALSALDGRAKIRSAARVDREPEPRFE